MKRLAILGTGTAGTMMANRLRKRMPVGAGCRIYARKATVEMFKLTRQDFCAQVDKVLTVGEFYELSAGAQIIFT